ncbi:MAG TPA: ChbG/HpnK family deacetylase, partial [Phycisphaerae bacterium]|nr:ChbG/HpnK family deacetylase [Phycisphaerae bacterium]
VRYMNSHKFAKVLYNPFFDNSLRYIYQAQMEEFLRLYGKPPSHVDGHRHNHLCTNLLVRPVIPVGQKVRRSFTFSAGEKGRFNLAYRRMVDKSLARRYVLTDYFFSLYSCLKTGQMSRMAELARKGKVELMAHPIKDLEYDFLMGNEFDEWFSDVKLESFSELNQADAETDLQPLLQGS